MPATKVEKPTWLKLGIKEFSTKGIQGINVEQMAKNLHCNKSSFYWHFKSKENFLNTMIQYWFENSIAPITVAIAKESNPKKRFENYLRKSFQDRSRKDFMFFLRKLAVNRPQLQELLEDLTKKRLEFTAMLLQDMGCSNSESRTKAEILLNFYVGWYEFNKYKKKNDAAIEKALLLIKDFIKF